MTRPVQSLADAIQDEITRVRRLQEEYKAMPNGVGSLGADLMEIELQRAVKALAGDNPIESLRVYEALKGFE